MRRLILVIAVAGTFCAAFALTSYARAGLFASDRAHVKISPALPIFESPAVSLAPAEQVALSNTIGSYGADMAGISPDSFSQIRAFAVTPTDRMYVVPGSKGVCLAFRNASTCGDPVAVHQIGLLQIDTNTGAVTGAGITDGSVTSLTEQVDNTSAVIPARHGVFVIRKNDGLMVSQTQPLRPHVSVTTG